MITIPAKLRNVICPWQTNASGALERGVAGQIRFVEQMLAKLDENYQQSILGLDKPDRIWLDKSK